MLSNGQLAQLCQDLGLSPEAQAIVETIRSSPPSRRVRSAAGNVTVRYPSRKMGVTIQAESHRNEYTLAQIKGHLHTFFWRFFKLSQFKRSCIPNAPKVGSGGSLSPRGDYRAPSDSEATVWMDQLDLIPDDPA